MMMQRTAAGMVERQLPYATLTAESAAQTYPARTFTSAAPRVAPSVATSPTTMYPTLYTHAWVATWSLCSFS